MWALGSNGEWSSLSFRMGVVKLECFTRLGGSAHIA